MDLRPYQEQSLAQVRDAFRDHRRVLLQGATGSGKTVMFAYLAARVSANGKRVCILVHRHELLHQASAKLTEFGVAHDIIDAKRRSVTRAPVVVASVQTMARRLVHYAECYDLLIVDEAHHATASTWALVLQAFPAAYVLGVTATPERADGVGLGTVFGELVLGPTVRDLIDQGHLADYRCFAPRHGGPDLSGIKTVAGDWDRHQLSAVMSRPTIVGDAVAHYRELATGRPAVAFCVGIKDAENCAENFRAAGYRAISVDGSLDRDERTRRIGGLASGEIQILTSCDLVSEGLDVPGIVAAILLRPTQSLGLYLQQVGRALRPKSEPAIILDHAGNTSRHGLPCQPREWSLHSKRRNGKSGAAPIRTCPECYAIVPAAAAKCACGHEFGTTPREPLEVIDDKLVEIKAFYGPDGRPTVERRRADIDAALAKCTSWDDLQALRKALGFKPFWAIKAGEARGWRVIRNKAGVPIMCVPHARAAA